MFADGPGHLLKINRCFENLVDFIDLDPDWIRIRIDQILWIRIHITAYEIHKQKCPGRR